MATAVTDGLPVLVYIHDGGFESRRTSKYPPETIVLGLTEPMIFVTMEYCLGQFGFLPGTAVNDNGVLSAGLLDQKAALLWVQKYINQFGGNPNNVTIWGQSAGAGSVVYHLIGNRGTNTGLFNQVMGDSTPFFYLPNYNDTFPENLFAMFANLAWRVRQPVNERGYDDLSAWGINEGLGDRDTVELDIEPNAEQYYPLVDYQGSLSLQGQQMHGEMRYICSVVMIASIGYAAGLPTYQYQWDNPSLSSTHSAELVAFFNNDSVVFNSADTQLVAAMTGYWMSFVTSGMPTSSTAAIS
ncbi:Alpha/Beta hydrolase protein [Mycena maculata]|uniref:Carboxylic ester hydrolase n=1 Tax=Mycena maculata TaxID=230809 RepID=A0AAD7HW15_9AGAR|nr:Alpha/Beta hydrolase protein [Mycena maculata]